MHSLLKCIGWGLINVRGVYSRWNLFNSFVSNIVLFFVLQKTDSSLMRKEKQLYHFKINLQHKTTASTLEPAPSPLLSDSTNPKVLFIYTLFLLINLIPCLLAQNK